MLGLLLVAAAAGAVAPVKAEPQGSPADWVLSSDLDGTDQAKVTTFDLMIDEVGRPVRCAIVIASGSDRLDKAVCAALMRRARFKPARDSKGSPVPAVYRDRVVWVPDGDGSNAWFKDADIVVTTPEIAKPLKGLSEVIVDLNDKGTVDDCFVTHAVGNEALDELACAFARSSKISLPITDGNGALVRGVRSFYVGYNPGNALGVMIR